MKTEEKEILNFSYSYRYFLSLSENRIPIFGDANARLK